MTLTIQILKTVTDRSKRTKHVPRQTRPVHKANNGADQGGAGHTPACQRTGTHCLICRGCKCIHRMVKEAK